MIAGLGYILALFISKIHLALYSQAFLVTSVEIGMGYAILFQFVMIALNLWPLRPQTFFGDAAFPTEDFLLNHLCLKWDIDTELPKFEKLSRIKQTLEAALKVKADFDQRARTLALKP